MQFDQYQQKVIEAEGGQLLVLAPPGCGKTELLTHRILRAHEAGIPLNDMLCLTFTNRAARGMRERIASVLGEVPDGLFVGNIHRFCSRFLFENHLVPSTTSIIDELDQRDILDEFGFTKYNENCQYRNQMISVGDVTKLATIRYLEIHDFPKNLSLAPPPLTDQKAQQTASRIAEQYLAYKEDNNVIDFDDILIQAYQAMCKEDGGNLLYSSFRWIQVDEVQDMNPLQLAIIERLTSTDNPTVMYLGDEQQAIYSFMGAKLNNLAYLAEKAKGNILRLYTNYRSPKYLVDMLNTYATKQLGLDSKFLPVANGNEEAIKGDLNIFRYPTELDEEGDITSVVRRLVTRFPDERVAILVRSNAMADVVSDNLTSGRINHFRLSGKDIFRTDEYKTLISHFAVTQQDTNFFEWARVLWKTGATQSFTDARLMMSRLRNAAMTPVDLMEYDCSGSYVRSFLDTYRNEELVIFDTETTGLDVFEDDIIQIAAIKIRGGELVEGSELNLLIRTDREIPPMLGKEVNPMLEVYNEGPLLEPEDAFRIFLEYVGDDDVLGHNVEYDYNILKWNLLRRAGRTFIEEHIHRYWDSLKLIRLLEPRQRVYKLKVLLEAFGLEGQNSHRADDDILATKSLVDYCAGKIPEKLSLQEQLLKDINIRTAAVSLNGWYRDAYRNTRLRLASPAPFSEFSVTPAFIDELTTVYKAFSEGGKMEPIPMFEQIVAFLSQAVFSGEEGTAPLRDHVARHLSELKTFTQADLCESGVLKEKVFVMTVHKAKGLEFEHVIMYNALDDVYPDFRSKTEAEIMEDARVFYVGISRAKKRVTLTYTDYNKKGFQKKITRFMESVKDRFKEYKPIKQ